MHLYQDALGRSFALFGCETSGYQHVCATPISTAAAGMVDTVTDLTPLECDNQSWELLEGVLFVTHNCDNVDTLGVASITLATADTVAATGEKILHLSPNVRTTVILGKVDLVAGITSHGNSIVRFANGVTAAAEVAVLQNRHNSASEILLLPADGSTNGRLITNSQKPPTPALLEFVLPKLVTFQSVDGLFTIHAQLFLPVRCLCCWFCG